MEVSVRVFTLHIRLAFDENWRPHLEAVRHFLETRGVRVGLVGRKESFNTWNVVVSNTTGVVDIARNLVQHCTKKRGELEAVMDYYSNVITGDEFVAAMNSFVMKGERTGKIRGGGPLSHMQKVGNLPTWPRGSLRLVDRGNRLNPDLRN